MARGPAQCLRSGTLVKVVRFEGEQPELKPRVCVVMPAFNEADGIGGFVRELCTEDSWECEVVVVNDCSTDDTARVLSELALTLPVISLQTQTNSGHGIATVAALREGLSRGPDLVVAVDGDGQIYVDDLARLVRVAVESDADVIEGVRIGRTDPMFRVVVSWATKAIVGVRAGSFPRDANTPNRVYKPAALQRLLDLAPSDSAIPNLWFSLLVRRRRFAFREELIRGRARRGSVDAGTMWGGERKELPNRKFLVFCLIALKEWLRPIDR